MNAASRSWCYIVLLVSFEPACGSRDLVIAPSGETGALPTGTAGDALTSDGDGNEIPSNSGSSTGESSTPGDSSSADTNDNTGDSSSHEPSSTSGTGSATPSGCDDLYLPRTEAIVCEDRLAQCEFAKIQSSNAFTWDLSLVRRDEHNEVFPDSEMTRRRDCVAAALADHGAQDLAGDDSLTFVATFNDIAPVLEFVAVWGFAIVCDEECSAHCFDFDGTACQADVFCQTIGGSRVDTERWCLEPYAFAACIGADSVCDSAPHWKQGPTGDCWELVHMCPMAEDWTSTDACELGDGPPPCE